MTYTFPASFERDLASLDHRSILFGSSVNMDKPDYTAHPKYKLASPIRVVLEPGSCLYLPAFWGHEVQSIPDTHAKLGAGERLNIAVNFWYANVTAPIDENEVLLKSN